MLPTTRGFHVVRVQESANSRASGTGGIAYHYVSDTYIALFSKFIPVGVWEAVHIIQGLLDQQSKVKPGTIHADTQGQALPVYDPVILRRIRRCPRPVVGRTARLHELDLDVVPGTALVAALMSAPDPMAARSAPALVNLTCGVRTAARPTSI